MGCVIFGPESDRTGPVLFGPDFCQIRFSVRSGPGPDQWTEFEQNFFLGKKAAQSCHSARADHAALLAASEGWKFSPNAQKKNYGERGGTVVPLGTGRPCRIVAQQNAKGRSWSIRSDPVRAFPGPVLGPPPTPNSVFGPGRSGPVRDRCTPLVKCKPSHCKVIFD